MYTPANGEAKKENVVIRAISAVGRALFDVRTQNLIKAGYISPCAEFTPAFDEAVRLVMLEKYGAEIEALAVADIKARKEAKESN